MDFDLGNDEECREKRLLFFKQFLQASGLRAGVEMDFCFEAAADGLCGAGLLESHEYGGTYLCEPFPFFRSVFGDPTRESGGFRKEIGRASCRERVEMA